MTWFRFDTSFPSHDKILELVELYGQKGMAAGFVYTCMLALQVGHENDGVIKKTSLRAAFGKPGDAALLVAVGLWEPIDTGWRVVNFGNRQVVGAAQQVISESKSAAGKKGAEARWKDDGS